MKILIVLNALIIGLICPFVSSAQELSAAQTEAKEQAIRRASPDWQARTAIVVRVEAGDKQALGELSALDPVVAIPVLARHAKDRSTDAEAAAIARAALKKVRGVRDYFRPRIAELHARPAGDADTLDEFETLTLIATKEAVAAAAPFLFDDSEPRRANIADDVGISSIRYQAVMALMEMKLPDAPTNKPFYAANEEDLKKWREWWLAHKAEYEQ